MPSVATINAAVGGDPNLQQMGPYNDGDAGTEVIQVRHTIIIPFTFLANKVTPRFFWETVMAEKLIALPCSDIFRLLSHKHPTEAHRCWNIPICQQQVANQSSIKLIPVSYITIFQDWAPKTRSISRTTLPPSLLILPSNNSNFARRTKIPSKQPPPVQFTLSLGTKLSISYWDTLIQRVRPSLLQFGASLPMPRSWLVIHCAGPVRSLSGTSERRPSYSNGRHGCCDHYHQHGMGYGHQRFCHYWHSAILISRHRHRSLWTEECRDWSHAVRLDSHYFSRRQDHKPVWTHLAF